MNRPIDKPTLKYLRELALESQRELADFTGVPLSTLYYVEHGRRSIRARHAVRIVQHLNARFKDLRYDLEPLSVQDIAWEIHKHADASLANLQEFQRDKRTRNGNGRY